jgi:hypothetical protein
MFGLKGLGRVPLGQSAALYCRVSTADQTFARQERDLRAFAKKAGYRVVTVWKETASGTKQERRTQEGLGFGAAPQGRRNPRHELTRWGRSPAGFAARSVTCFKFRFVSSPLIAVHLETFLSHCSKKTTNSSGGRSHILAFVFRYSERTRTLSPREFKTRKASSSVRSSPR